ncbi:alpha/beta fold hydrolase [Microlunatus parietis]|uniref:Pimeloyl-ACP methyl ester carboxylesterase n=1 Tax=Microlunatus parietis TaxID=682979 RepID=A0A7Y9I7Q9_9ACTN|nr:alpha/beta hydrolase [Microlunatus parietis]NYE71844.1 pimeloyl-ACP methyl ester carboxylesterase [Microlunatus parietis]
MEKLTIRRDGAAIPVTVAGDGPAAVFVPGLGGTQAQLGALFEGLRRHLRLATFDHRGHGTSSVGGPYDYPTFGADTSAVLDALGGPGSLVLIGHSMGADLLVDQAAALPAAPRGLILIDGGTPLSSSLLTPAELEGMRQAMGSEEALELQRSLAGTPHQVALSGDDIFRLQDEIDQHRRTAAERFDRIDGPITMIMSEFMAGTESDRARELNQAWRDAVDTLAASRPTITVRRVPAGHDLVATHPDEVLELIVAALAAGQ